MEEDSAQRSNQQSRKDDAYIIPTGTEEYRFTKAGMKDPEYSLRLSWNFRRRKRNRRDRNMLTTGDKLLHMMREERNQYSRVCKAFRSAGTCDFGHHGRN